MGALPLEWVVGGEEEAHFGRLLLIVIRNVLEIPFQRRELSSKSQLHGELHSLFCNRLLLAGLAAVSCKTPLSSNRLKLMKSQSQIYKVSVSMGTAFTRSTRLHFSYSDPLLSSMCIIDFITDPLIRLLYHLNWWRRKSGCSVRPSVCRMCMDVNAAGSSTSMSKIPLRLGDLNTTANQRT